MASTGRTGKIQTVLGLIEPDELGITLTHEHALIDLSCYFVMPEEATERWYVDKPVTTVSYTHLTLPTSDLV